MQSQVWDEKKRRDDFRMREYQAVLDKITHARADVARVETVYPLAIAAIYAWIFSNPPSIPLLWKAALILPVGIALLGIVRLHSRRKHMTLLETYVRELEFEVYGNDAQLGWERRYARAKPLRGLIVVRALIAAAILGVTLLLAWNADPLFQGSKDAQATESASK